MLEWDLPQGGETLSTQAVPPGVEGRALERRPSDPNRVRWAVLREVILFGGAALGIVLCFLTDLSPYLSVRWVDFQVEQENMPGWKDPELKVAPLAQFIAARTEGKLLTLDGVEWKAFIEALRSWDESGALPPEWRPRVVEETYYRGPIHFRPNDPPISLLMPRLETLGGGYLYHPEAGYASLTYVAAPEGPGLMYSGPNIPSPFLYPHRTMGLIVLALAVLGAIGIPWPPKADGLVNVSWGRIFPHILVGLLLGVFFLLPFLIVQGSVETITEAFPITIVCWMFVIGALMVVYVTVKVEAASVAIQPDGLVVSTLAGGVELYRYDEIVEIKGLVMQPPKWLIWGLRLGAPLAPTAGSALTALGQAEILSASEGGGFRIIARDGRSVCLWFTDQMGGVIFRNFDQLLEALEANRVPVSAEPEMIRGFFPPDR